MDKIQNLFYELHFELYFYRERGNNFEDFFAKIMKFKHGEDFAVSKVWGNKGDLKCDGFISKEKTLFQVYAPNDITHDKLMAKIKEDYTIGVNHWRKHIDKWVFVQNAKDGVRGIAAPTILAIESMKLENAIPITIWGIDEVKQIVFSLPLPNLIDLFGEVPSFSDFNALQISSIEPFLKPFAMISQLDLGNESIKEVPEDKIEINNLSEYIQGLIKLGIRKAHLIELIMEKWSDIETVQNLSVSFKKMYEDIREQYPNDADQIFYELKKFAGGQVTQTPQDELAIITILAYLFENCTIFESVPSNA